MKWARLCNVDQRFNQPANPVSAIILGDYHTVHRPWRESHGAICWIKSITNSVAPSSGRKLDYLAALRQPRLWLLNKAAKSIDYLILFWLQTQTINTYVLRLPVSTCQWCRKIIIETTVCRGFRIKLYRHTLPDPLKTLRRLYYYDKVTRSCFTSHGCSPCYKIQMAVPGWEDTVQYTHVHLLNSRQGLGQIIWNGEMGGI